MQENFNNKQVVIAVTHDGVFHSDEVLACALLRIAAEPSHVAVIRSRLPRDWERADYVIDVGGRCDGIKWFDHHQPEGAGKRDNNIPFSAFGLVWNNLGVTAVRQLLKTHLEQHTLDETDVQEVINDLAGFVAGIDAHDQAVLSTVGRFTKDRSVTVDVVTLQQIISSHNPVPLLEDPDDTTSTKYFYEVLDWVEKFLRRYICRKASRVLSEKYVAKYDIKDSVLVLPRHCDWKTPVSHREHVLFVVYPSVNGKSYTVQCASKSGGHNHTSNLRMAFPQSWAGLTEGDLRKVSEVSDAVFCHRDRFIAAALSLQGAVTLAKKAVQQTKQTQQTK